MDGRKMNAETVKRKNRFPAPALSGSGSKGLSQVVPLSETPTPNEDSFRLRKFVKYVK